jgi:hypothetical protein
VINVDDNTAPVITGTIAPVTVEGCTASDASAPLTTVAGLEALGITINDACTPDNALTVTSTESSAGTCPVVVTRTYTITDACGNSATVTQVINVDDNTAPVITGTIAPVTVESEEQTYELHTPSGIAYDVVWLNTIGGGGCGVGVFRRLWWGICLPLVLSASGGGFSPLFFLDEVKVFGVCAFPFCVTIGGGARGWVCGCFFAGLWNKCGCFGGF